MRSIYRYGTNKSVYVRCFRNGMGGRLRARGILKVLARSSLGCLFYLYLYCIYIDSKVPVSVRPVTSVSVSYLSVAADDRYSTYVLSV
jgi:hypothetical protein